MKCDVPHYENRTLERRLTLRGEGDMKSMARQLRFQVADSMVES